MSDGKPKQHASTPTMMGTKTSPPSLKGATSQQGGKGRMPAEADTLPAPYLGTPMGPTGPGTVSKRDFTEGRPARTTGKNAPDAVRCARGMEGV